MDLNAVDMFVHVVQSGSLSAGSERAGVPLPTLSRRVRALERDLKVQLFDRSVRGTRLTEAGARLYEFALRGIETLAEGEQALRSDQANLRGRLRLSLPPAFEPWWRLLREFQRRYPGVELIVQVTERRLDLIEEGVDVALRVGPIIDESLIARQVLTYRHLLVASPEFIDRLGEPKSLSDLSRYPLAAWIAGSGHRAEWRLDNQAFRPTPVLATNDYLHLRDAAYRGRPSGLSGGRINLFSHEIGLRS